MAVRVGCLAIHPHSRCLCVISRTDEDPWWVFYEVEGRMLGWVYAPPIPVIVTFAGRFLLGRAWSVWSDA